MKKKNPEKQANIIAAASTMILRDGAGALSTAKVARAVGIAQSNIYIYFRDRQALLAAVFEHAQASGERYLDAAVLQDTTAPVAARLRIYLEGMYTWSVNDPVSLHLVAQVKQLPGEENLAQTPRLAVATGLFHEAIAAGICRSLPVSLLLTVPFAVIRRNADLPVNERQAFDQLLPLLWGALTTQ